MVTVVLLRLVAVLLLVAANAFFVGAEFALVSVRETRIQQLILDRRIGARTVQKLHQNLDEVLNAVQFGITIASLALGWVGEPALAYLIQPLFGRIPYAQVYAHGIAIVCAFTIITYMHVIFGEVVPKTLALQRAERMALAVAAPMDFFMTLFRPFLYVMNNSSRVILKLFGSRPVREGSVHSPDELKLIVTASRHIGLLPPIQEDVIHRALELGNVTAREIMTPRPDIFSLPADLSVEEALGRVVEAQLSRIPVYDPKQGPENILGVLYAKDLMRLLYVRMAHIGFPLRPGTTRLRNIMRDVLVVPETKPVADLLLEFKQRRRHLAVVVDEFGSTVGVVTAEDVLKQIVGELEDEFDRAKETPIALEQDKPGVLDGAENIRELETQYNLALPRDQGFESLGGFVLSRLQRIPKGGESFEWHGHRFTVLKVDGHRIASVKIEPAGASPPSPAAD
jgi:CBS domain containing-hemolysin-like protein